MGVAACAGSGSGGSGASGGNQKVTIQFWTNDTNPVEKQIVAAFNASHPNINVQLTAYQTDTYLSALATGASNRSLPDVLFEGLGDTLAHEYEDAGLIENLTPYAKQLGWQKEFSPLSVKLLTYKGQWYEEPLYDIAMGIFYRKDVFAKLHMAVPTTFAEFVTDLGKIKAAGYTPISLGGEDYWLPMRFFDALLEYYGGNDYYTKLAERKVSWNSKPVVEAFTTMRSWTQQGYFTPGFLSINPVDDYVPFFQGTDAMVLEGSFEDATIVANQQKASDYGFFPFPQDETPNLLSTFAQGLMIAKNTQHLQAALAFIEYYDSPANLTKFGSQLTQPFARLGVAPPANQPQAAQIASLINSEGTGYLPIDQILPQQLVNSFSVAQANDITGSMTPAQSAASLASAVAAYKGAWPWGSQAVP
ncbi:MAG TPA: extracellular solute-binding protein [Trebonia sp.]|nr:extracellular solute-binding protein [Trebonia sp.]